MSRVYRSAQGRVVDIEKLRLANEETIAVGNMKVNARGDQLGEGGRVVKSRNQLMKEYYELNTPTSRGGRATPRATADATVTESDPVVIDEAASELDREMAEFDRIDAEEENFKPRTKKKNEL